MFEKGLKRYLFESGVTNYFDIIISVTWVILFFIRNAIFESFLEDNRLESAVTVEIT